MKKKNRIQIFTTAIIVVALIALSYQMVLAALQGYWPSTASPSDNAVATTGASTVGQLVTKTSDGDYIVVYTLTNRPYGQKFSGSDGSVISAWNSGFPAIVSTYAGPYAVVADSSGGAYVIANADLGGGDCDVFLQRVDSTGSRQLGTNGTAITTGSGCEVFMDMIPDGSGGVYIVWGNGGATVSKSQTTDLYATRVTSAGAVHSSWNTGGSGTFRPLQLPESAVSASEHSAQMVADGSGNVIVAYESTDASFYYAATKFSSSGVLASSPWNTPLEIDDSSNGNLGRHIAADGSGGIVVGFLAGTFGSPSSVEAQKINSAGALQWSSGVSVSSTSISSYSGQPRIVSDGSGGAIIAWQTAAGDTYGHHITSAGSLDSTGSWSSAPIALSNTSDSQTDWFVTLDRGTIQSDGSGGAYVLYGSYEGGSYAVSKLQHLESDGSVEFAGDGTSVDSGGAGIEGVESIMISDGGTGVVVVYQDESPSSDMDLYIQLFDNFDPNDGVGVSVTIPGTLTISDDGVPISIASLTPDSVDTGEANTITVSSNSTSGFNVSIGVEDLDAAAGQLCNNDTGSCGSNIFDADGTASYVSFTSDAGSGGLGSLAGATFTTSETKIGTSTYQTFTTTDTSNSDSYDIHYDIYADNTISPDTYEGVVTFTITAN